MECLRHRLFGTLLTLAVLALFAVPGAHALNNNTLRWRTARTEHFEVLDASKDPHLACRVAEMAEAIYDRVARALGHEPRKRTRIILSAQGDAAFGYTDALTEKVTLGITPADELEFHEGPWLKAILAHEYTHAVMTAKLETVKGGIGRLLGWASIPMWFIEGLAQRVESPWDAFKETAVRSALLSNAQLSLKQLDTFYFFNSSGRRLGYHMGNALVNHIAERHGDRAIPEILRLVRGKVFGFGRAVKTVTKRTVKELFEEWRAGALARAQAFVVDRDMPATFATLLTDFPGANLCPRFSPDGTRLYFLSNRDRDFGRFTLYVRDLSQQTTRKLEDDLQAGFDVSPDGLEIVFSRKTRNRYGDGIDDLFLLTLRTGDVRRLTSEAHASQPAFSRDGKTIFCGINQVDQRNLARYDRKTSKITVLSHNPEGVSIHSPIPSPDGRKVFFTGVSADGHRDIWSYDLATRRVEKAISMSAQSLHPGFAQGIDSDVVLFLTDRSGALDLASARAGDRSGLFLTRVATGVLDYDWHATAGLVAFTAPVGREVKIYVAPIVKLREPESFVLRPAAVRATAVRAETVRSARPRSAGGPETAPPAGNGFPDLGSADPLTGRPSGDSAPGPQTRARVPAGFASTPARDASTGSRATAYPHALKLPDVRIQTGNYREHVRMEYIVPMAGSVGRGVLLGAMTRFADTLGYHTILLNSLYGFSGRHANTLTYRYTGLAPTVGLNLFDLTQEVRPGQIEKQVGANLFMNWSLIQGYSITASLFDQSLSSISISPFLPFRNPTLGFGSARDRGYAFAFQSARAAPSIDRVIHPINGSYFSAVHRKSVPEWGSVYDYEYSRFDVARVLTLSPRRDSVTLRVMGGRASRDFDFQLGGPLELRGYRARPLAGKNMGLATVEYNFPALEIPVKLGILQFDKTYPTIFYDVGEAWTNLRNVRHSYGLEARSRILAFKKTPIYTRSGLAVRRDGSGTELYGNFEIDF